MPDVGSTFAGLRIEAEVGHGGMGTVYRATRIEDGVEVALKLLHPHLAKDPEFVRRFQREAKLAEKLAHPNVVRVLGSGEEDGTSFVVMEFVRGESLTQRMRTAGIATPPGRDDRKPEGDAPPVTSLPLPEVYSVLRQVCGVLQAAEGIGLVHRDVKPDNVILTEKGQVKVLDFGLAKDLGSGSTALSMTGQSLGTPAYMSPEQALGSKSVDHRSDLYSLGCTAYQMVTGRTPFRSGSATGYAQQHIGEIAPSAIDVNPSVPKGLSQVIDRLLAKKQEDRHQSAGELLEDLNRVERGDKPLKTYRGRTERKVSLGLVAALVLVAAAAVGGFLWYQGASGTAEQYRQLVAAGDTAREKGDWDGALASYESARGLRPGQNVEARIRAVADRKRESDDTKSRAEGERKRQAFDVRRRSGLVAFESGDYTRARGEFEAALREQEDAGARRDLKECVRHVEEYDKALADAKRAEGVEDFGVAAQAYLRAAAALPSRKAESERLAGEADAKAKTTLPWAAVLDFEATGAAGGADLGKTVAVLLESALSSSYRLRERGQVEKILGELRFQSSDLADRTKAQQVGKALSAKYLVLGNVVRAGDLVLTAKLVDVETFAIRQTADATAAGEAALQPAVKSLAHVLPMSTEQKRTWERAVIEYPKHVAAAQAAERAGKWDEAQVAWQRAVDADPKEEACDCLDRCRRRGEYETRMKSAQALMDAERWMEAEAAYAAAEVFAEGAGVTATAAQGGAARARRSAKQVEYQSTMDAARRLVDAKDWAGAERAYSDAERLAAEAGVDASAATAGRSQASDRARYDRLGELAPGKYDEATLAGMRTLFASGAWRLAEQAVNGGGLLEVVHLQTGLTFALIPGGVCDIASRGRGNDATPARRLTIRAFLLSRTECTQAAYRAVTGSSPSKSTSDSLPVEQVSYESAWEYCKKSDLRLPTEEEWEYACRAGTTGDFGFEGDASRLAEFAWFDENSQRQTHQVARKKPNAYGLFDMHGNVWEWCNGYIHPEDSYNHFCWKWPNPDTNATHRVCRGGSWEHDANNARSWYRGGGVMNSDYSFVGFRPARSVAPE